jgi:hypothetical protein
MLYLHWMLLLPSCTLVCILGFCVVYIYIYIRYWWTSGFGLPVRGTVVTHKDYWSRASIVFYLATLSTSIANTSCIPCNA